jgi:hypothetical protein
MGFPRLADAVAVSVRGPCCCIHLRRCRIGLQDVTASATATFPTDSSWRWLSSGMLSTYMMTAAGQALWGPGEPNNSDGAVRFFMHVAVTPT